MVDARPQDMEKILDLAVAASTFTFNGLRSTPSECVQGIRNEFGDLQKYLQRGTYRFLVALDQDTDTVIGYLMLDLYDIDDLGRRQTFIEDCATLPDYAGQGVAHALYAEAIKTTADLGVDFMGAEFAASNPFYEASLRNGCILESYRVVRPCTKAAYEKLEVAKQYREADKTVQSKLTSLKERREAGRARRHRKT